MTVRNGGCIRCQNDLNAFMHFHSSTEKDVIVMLLPSNYFSVIFKPPAWSESTLRDSQEMQLSHGHLSPLWIEALLH